jgi:hypothetical protein
MTSRARLAWPALAGALLVLLAAAWLVPGPAAAPRHLPAVITPAAPQAPGAMVSQWGGTALARPLFSPGRRPQDQQGATADGTLPRLSAIIVSGGTGAAVFAASGQRPQVVNQGGTIGGYVLNRIAPDHIELAGPAGTLTLHPQFTPAAAAATAPANPPTSPPGGQTGGQTGEAVLNPSSNPAVMIEQNF